VEQIADALRPLLKQTFEAYAPLAQQAGVQNMIRQTGYVVAYATRAGLQRDALPWKLRRDRGVLMEELDGPGIRQKVPQLGGNFEAGLYLPEQGFVTNPERLTQALAAQFQKDGGRIVQRKVLDIEVSPEGPRALVTDAGHMALETLVICAGSHSNELTIMCGDKVPLEAERGYHVTFSDPRVTLPMPVFLPQQKVFVTPMEMGLRIAGQSEFAGNEAEPNYARADVLTAQMKQIFPQISSVDATQWMGRRPSMPDSLPVIGPASKLPNVYYAFGHGHVGLCGGAPTGRAIADLIAGRAPVADMKPFSVNRF
jgi:D-amino-acid dehydrogenase